MGVWQQGFRYRWPSLYINHGVEGVGSPPVSRLSIKSSHWATVCACICVTKLLETPPKKAPVYNMSALCLAKSARSVRFIRRRQHRTQTTAVQRWQYIWTPIFPHRLYLALHLFCFHGNEVFTVSGWGLGYFPEAKEEKKRQNGWLLNQSSLFHSLVGLSSDHFQSAESKHH